MEASADTTPLRKIEPGPVYRWVRWISWIELAVFAALVFFWLAPGFDRESFIFGMAHGIGYLLLCAVIWAAVLRHEAPYVLLAATLTPVGPVGSVIGIGWIDRKREREGEGSGEQPTQIPRAGYSGSRQVRKH